MRTPKAIKMLREVLEVCPLLDWAFWSIVKDRMTTTRKGQAIKETAIDLANFIKEK